MNKPAAEDCWAANIPRRGEIEADDGPAIGQLMILWRGSPFCAPRDHLACTRIAKQFLVAT